MWYGLEERPRLTSGAVIAIVATTLVACRADESIAPRTDTADLISPAVTAADTTLLFDRYGYAWADQPTAATYTPSPNYAYNARGGAITITRSGVGQYDVHFDALSSFPQGGTETVVASTYGSSTIQCTPTSWVNLAFPRKLVAHVECIDMRDGARADSRFTILTVGSITLPPRSAFAFANRPLALSYTPDSAFSYTTGTTPMQITHNSFPGDYNVQLGTGGPRSGYIVSSHQARRICKIGQWIVRIGPRVRCFDRDGNSVDATFQVLEIGRNRQGRRLGYAAANRLTDAVYTPDTLHSYNSSGGLIESRRVGTGRYQIEFHGLGTLTSRTETVLLNAFGTSATSCNVVGWGDVVNVLRVHVECRNAQDVLADSRYEIVVFE
jgi:hypothetical protein